MLLFPPSVFIFNTPASSLPPFPSTLLLSSTLIAAACCHANFPGDSVVMDTGRQGKSADVWCRSGMCTYHSPVCALSFSFLLYQPDLFVIP